MKSNIDSRLFRSYNISVYSELIYLPVYLINYYCRLALARKYIYIKNIRLTASLKMTIKLETFIKWL